MKRHQGINIAKIPVAGGAGAVFVLGIVAIFWIGLPAFRFVLVFGIVGGLLVGAGLHLWHNR